MKSVHPFASIEIGNILSPGRLPNLFYDCRAREACLPAQTEQFLELPRVPRATLNRTISSGGNLLRQTIFGVAFLSLLIFSVATLAFATNNEDLAVNPNPNIDLASELGIHFVGESATKIIVERNGKDYEVDLATHEIRELSRPAESSSAVYTEPSAPPAQATASTGNAKQQSDSSASNRRYYRPGDDLLFTLPTGRPIEKHSWDLNFTHRFPYEPAFTTPARGATFLGLDDFSVSSFGAQYGVTSHLSVSAYRSPSVIGRPIELGARYNFLDERHGPFNAAARFSVDGADDFTRNFTSNFELQVSRSIGHRAQVYVVPTASIHNRPVISAPSSLTEPPAFQPCAQQFANGVDPSLRVHPCANTFSVGFGTAIDIRPTVAFVGEVIPTAVNGTEMGIHRMPFAFGVQKKIFHHSFTFGFTTAPGTNTSQRIATRSIFLGDPHNDTPSGMFAGFDLMRALP
jgi:hypothetical protein